MHNYVYNYIYMYISMYIYNMCVYHVFKQYIYIYIQYTCVRVCVYKYMCVYLHIHIYILCVCIYLLVFKDMPNFKPWSSFVPLAALALTLTYRNCSFDHVSNVSSIGILIPLDQFFTVVTLFGSPQEPSGIRASRLLRVAVRPRSARPSGIK
jgi:hypothetical protein